MPHPNDGEVICISGFCRGRTKLDRKDINCWKCGSTNLDRSKLALDTYISIDAESKGTELSHSLHIPFLQPKTLAGTPVPGNKHKCRECKGDMKKSPTILWLGGSGEKLYYCPDNGCTAYGAFQLG